ncbi:MAG: pro-sigmaK processing inhibitor BofA family protein [Anaerovoracaceae bacterium]
MGMGLEIGILLAYAFGVLIIYFLGYFLLVPAKILLRLVVNSVLGGLVILLINVIGFFWGLHIPLNVLTAIIVGVLGIPGVLLLLLF